MNLVFLTASPRNQSVYCGTTDTSVDFLTPTPDTDTVRPLVLDATFLGRSQLVELNHALASQHEKYV